MPAMAASIRWSYPSAVTAARASTYTETNAQAAINIATGTPISTAISRIEECAKSHTPQEGRLLLRNAGN